jgi:hypothetical protein
MAIVSIGPHLMKNGMNGLVAPDIEHTGYSIELSSDEFTLNACLYRRIFHWQRDKIQLGDLCVCVDQIPFSLTPISKTQQKDSPIGKIVSLDAALCSLYIKHEVKRPITSLLAEFRDHLPTNHCYYPRIENGSKMMNPVLADAGFEVIHFFPYGRTLSVLFGWVYPQDRQNLNAKINVYAGTIVYKPRPDRTLGKGQWLFPAEATVSYLFTDMLESKGQKEVLSEPGIKVAVENFKWTRVSLLSNQEAKQARIDFVRAHPELHNNHHALARALKEAELYSDTAQIYAIKKQVPRLILETTGK